MAGGIDMTIVHYPGAPQALDRPDGRAHPRGDREPGDVCARDFGGQAQSRSRSRPRSAWKTAPDLPAVAETLPGFLAMGWFALMAPPGTPELIARKVSADLRTVLAQPDVERRG